MSRNHKSQEKRRRIQAILFTNRDIADYYNQTQNHYHKWWRLRKNLAVHYGIWDNGTTNFDQALLNTNRVMMEIARVQETAHVLDAGCGVGGSGVYLAKSKKARVVGLTLSERQYEFALANAKELQLTHLLEFHLQDYASTNFPDKTFDLVWCIESITSAPNKSLFAKEAFRLLKPGGKLIIADYFRTEKSNNYQGSLLENWQNTWSLAPIESLQDYLPKFVESGFKILENHNYTTGVLPTARRMYFSSILGALPSFVYNAFHSKVSRFAKTHYKSGYYQYKALKKGLWEYRILLFEKK